jgi:ribosomal 50S subunit-recycling heat shock protein
MRLDLFLKISRLIPRRSLAQEFCDAGLISVNGIVAKPSKEVKVGDEVEIKRRSRHTKIVVAEIPSAKQISKSSAGELYRLIEETVIADDPLS